MAATSAALLNLLQKKADLAYYNQQQIYFANKQESTSAKVAKYAKYEKNWEKAYDDAMALEDGKSKTCNGVTVTGGSVTERQAEAYAYAKVRERDEELYLELTDLDMEYDSMKEMYNTLCEELRAEIDADKQLTSSNAQDTGLLQS